MRKRPLGWVCVCGVGLVRTAPFRRCQSNGDGGTWTRARAWNGHAHIWRVAPGTRASGELASSPARRGLAAATGPSLLPVKWGLAGPHPIPPQRGRQMAGRPIRPAARGDIQEAPWGEGGGCLQKFLVTVILKSSQCGVNMPKVTVGV